MHKNHKIAGLTVQVDYRVTHSLTMCRYYYQLRMLRSDAL